MPLTLDLTEDVKKPLREAGAALIGYADVSPVAGRPGPELTCALALAVAFDPFLAGRPGAPLADAAYVDEYYFTRARLDQLVRRAEAIFGKHGYQAWGYGFRPFFGQHIDDLNSAEHLTARYQQKTTAIRANLGWIGKMGVLVTREYGPHVWLGTVLTDAPLPVANPAKKSRCGTCRLC